jgi:hypothetical protein
MEINSDKWINILFSVADLEILVKYLEGETDFEVLDRIEFITEGLRDWLEHKKREIQESDS